MKNFYVYVEAVRGNNTSHKRTKFLPIFILVGTNETDVKEMALDILSPFGAPAGIQYFINVIPDSTVKGIGEAKELLSRHRELQAHKAKAEGDID